MDIVIAGDFCDQFRVIDRITEGDFDGLFGNIKSYVEDADYSIVNFEFPIANGKCSPIEKCGPNLKGRSDAIYAIKHAGFNVATLANNHILDQGAECAIETQNALIKAGFMTVGLGGGSLQPREKILYLYKDLETIAVINCCEHEFSVTSPEQVGANPLSAINQYYQIKEAHRNADKVIVIVHGGHEGYQLPSPRMKELYRYFVDIGADAVVNHHQHCFSGYEIYNGKPIFYGLGNFLFDWPGKRNGIWNEGFMLKLAFTNSNISFQLIPYSQCNADAKVNLLTDEESIAFNNKITQLNRIIADDTLLYDEYERFLSKQIRGYESIFEPYNSRYLRALYHRGLIPSLSSRKRLLEALNDLNCESHFDRVLFSLKKIINA